MQTSYPDLLPRNATVFEKALSGPTGRLDDIPVPIRDLWRWDTCPEEHLPWLAWAMSVDIWSHDWPVEKKRAIIRESFELHRRKGTLYCVERYLAYADAELVSAIVPPDKPFAGASLTDEQRQAWLDRFPQIRIFQYRDRGTSTYGAFTRGGYKLSKTFLGAGPSSDPEDSVATKSTFFPYQTDAAERYGRRAFLWDKGSHFKATGLETALRWIERTSVINTEQVYDYEQVLIPGSKDQALFAGSFVKGNLDGKNGRMFPVKSVAPTRIVTVSLPRTQYTAEDRLAMRTISPSLEPIQAFSQKVAERGTSKLGVHMFAGMRGRWLDRETKSYKRITGFLLGYVPESTAGLRLYDRLYLHDKERQPDARPSAIYAGHFRLGMPAYHAQLSVQIRGKRSKYAFGRFVFGHTMPHDGTKLDLARHAIGQSKAFRDKVLINTSLTREVRTSDGITSGAGYRSGGLFSTT